MPNHVKNKIELKGNEADIKEFVEKYSTFFPSVQHKSYDGELTFKTKDGDIGWLDENTNVFRRRDKPSVLGVPDGFEPYMQSEWTRFIDFEKVFPVPECIKLVGSNVPSNIVDAVYAKYRKPFDTNPLLAYLKAGNRLRNENKIDPEEELQFERACKAYEETGFCYWYDYQNEKWGTKWNAYSCEKLSENTFMFETAWSNVIDIILEASKSFNGTIVYVYADEDTGQNCGSYLISGGIVLTDYIPCGGSKDAYEIAFDLRPHQREYYVLVDDNYQYKDED